MNYPDLPKWQLIAVPATVIILGNFFFAKYFVADELIYANHRIEAFQQDLQTALNDLEAEQARSTMAEREADVIRRATLQQQRI